MTAAERPPDRRFPRIIVVLVVVSVLVNVFLAAAVAVSAVYLIDLGHANAVNTARIHASQLQACALSNTARHQDIAIWNRLLTVTPAQKAQQTPAQRQEVRQLEHLVKVKDTPVSCVALYPGTG